MNGHASYMTLPFSFLVGALAGASVDLLVAPQAGRITREMMRRKVRDSATSARQLKDRVVRRGEQIGEEAAHRVTDAASALAGRGPHKVRADGEAVTSARLT